MAGMVSEFRDGVGPAGRGSLVDSRPVSAHLGGRWHAGFDRLADREQTVQLLSARVVDTRRLDKQLHSLGGEGQGGRNVAPIEPRLGRPTLVPGCCQSDSGIIRR
jgi:hypothetical protein